MLSSYGIPLVLLYFVLALCGASITLDTVPHRFKLRKGKKFDLTLLPSPLWTTVASDGPGDLRFLGNGTSSYPSTTAGTTAYSQSLSLNWTCSGQYEFLQGAESFLNYLLRLKTCEQLGGAGNVLFQECASRTYGYTEYYEVSYLAFCEPELYNAVCRQQRKNLNEVFSGDDPPFRYASAVTADRVVEFLRTEEVNIVDDACVDVYDFWRSLEKHELFTTEKPSDIFDEYKFTEVSLNTSAPVVVYSEWYNNVLPFCKPFVCGSSYSKYMDQATSFYDCMPDNCRLTIIFSIIFDSILAILTIVANSLVLGVAARTKIMRNTPGYFKISLAMADLIVGVFVLPACIFTTHTFYIGPLPFRHPGQRPYVTDYLSRPVANLIGFSVVLSFAASIYTMAVASLDRYLAITKPFKYRQGKYLTKRRSAFAFALIWFIAFFVAIYPVFTTEPYNLSAFNLLLSTGFSSSIVYAVGLLVPLVAVWSLNGAMLCQVCADGEKRRSIRATSVLQSANPMPTQAEAVPSVQVSANGGEVKDMPDEVPDLPAIVENGNGVTAPLENEAEVASKVPVSRNISSSSVSYHRNEKRSSVPTGGEGIIERMKRNRSKSRAAAEQRNSVARQPSIKNTTANVERRLAKTLAIMIGAFTLALAPTIVTLVVYVSTSRSSNPGESNRVASALYVASRILLSNSFWNCIIYSIRNRHFRRAMWAIFLCKKEKIDRKLRQSVTRSQWKRRSAMMSSSGPSSHEKHRLSKSISGASSAATYDNKEHRRSTIMWSLSTSSPCPSRKGSGDLLENKPAITRTVSNTIDLNVNKNSDKTKVIRSESAPETDCSKFTIPTVTIELIAENTEGAE